MTNPTTIDSLELSAVYGGQDLSAGATVKTPAVTAQGNFSSKGTPERRNDYNTCMNDRQAQCGWFQSPQSCQDMASRACTGLVGSPTNAQQSE